MRKNIKQNHLLNIKKVLMEVDKAQQDGQSFRAVVLMERETGGFFYLHAPQPDIESLVLNAMRSKAIFAYSVVRAVEKYCQEVKERKDKNNKEQSKSKENEENQIQEA